MHCNPSPRYYSDWFTGGAPPPPLRRSARLAAQRVAQLQQGLPARQPQRVRRDMNATPASLPLFMNHPQAITEDLWWGALSAQAAQEEELATLPQYHHENNIHMPLSPVHRGIKRRAPSPTIMSPTVPMSFGVPPTYNHNASDASPTPTSPWGLFSPQQGSPVSSPAVLNTPAVNHTQDTAAITAIKEGPPVQWAPPLLPRPLRLPPRPPPLPPIAIQRAPPVPQVVASLPTPSKTIDAAWVPPFQHVVPFESEAGLPDVCRCRQKKRRRSRSRPSRTYRKTSRKTSRKRHTRKTRSRRRPLQCIAIT